MDKKQIKNILSGLYKIDSGLARYENDLIKIINKLLKNKPEVRIDENFIQRLRSELMESAPKSQEKKFLNINFNFMQKLFYAFGGAAVTAAVILLLINFLPVRPEEPINLALPGKHGNEKIPFTSGEIKKLSANAFGNLLETGSASNLASGAGFGSVSKPASEISSVAPQAGMAKGLGGGGMARTQSGVGGDTAIMPYPEPVAYKYVYKGKGINLESDKMEIYKKNNSAIFNGSIPGLNTKLIDLSKFSGTALRSFNIWQDEKLGYEIYVDIENGLISVNNNSKGWYDYSVVCQTEECAEQSRLKPSDIPNDEELIAIANKFIKEKNIDISQYGQPRVEDYWKREYEAMADKSNAYIPDTMSLIYPLLLNGEEVKDLGGNDYGLRVNVNIRFDKVANLYGLGAYNLDSSEYSIVTSEEKILKMAEMGGYGYWYGYGDMKVVEVELGEPVLGYASYMRWKDGKNEELFIPSLVFPIMSQPEGLYYRKNIVVPLVEEFFNQDLNQPTPEPMPLIQKEGTSEPSQGAAGGTGVGAVEVQQ